MLLGGAAEDYYGAFTTEIYKKVAVAISYLFAYEKLYFKEQGYTIIIYGR
jgi:hypothetical protein